MRTFYTVMALAAISALALTASCGGGGTKDPACGNGRCEAGENHANCPVDCPAACGNGVCETGETNANCPVDCPAGPVCGNGACEAGETNANCPADCPAGPVCGNGTCEAGETEANCPADCSSTPTAWLSCSALNSCYGCCGNDDGCWDACDDAATATAVSQMDALYGCVGTSCANECGQGGTSATCNACVDTNCGTQLDACDWGLGGSGGCITLNNCLVPCTAPLNQGTAATCPSKTGNAGLACYQGCFDSVDDQAVELLIDVMDCVDEQCEAECGAAGTQQGCQTCQSEKCSNEIGACQSDG